MCNCSCGFGYDLEWFEGYLEKFGSNKKWQRRYFEVFGHYLRYYPDSVSDHTYLATALMWIVTICPEKGTEKNERYY